MICWTYKCLSLGGYTVDCPHRERLGYGGDSGTSMEMAMLSFRTGPFYAKWAADWRDAADPAGRRALLRRARTYANGEQTYLVLPLLFGITPRSSCRGHGRAGTRHYGHPPRPFEHGHARQLLHDQVPYPRAATTS